MRTYSLLVIVLVVGIAMLLGCSEDCDCPTCPVDYIFFEWSLYDDFDDNVIDGDLWGYSIAYGGQVLETSGQLQVWGHTSSWTGSGVAWTIEESHHGWRFDLVEAYFEEGPGCQGWHIRATNPARTVRVELLNGVTAGCTNPPNWGDTEGVYKIRHEGDSLAVYLDGGLLRRLYDNGLDVFKMEFYCDNVYGSGHHSHIFIDDVECLDIEP